MVYVFVGKVVKAHDGTFLDSPFLLLLVHAHGADFVSPLLQLLDDLGAIHLHFLNVEGTFHHLQVVALVILEVGISFGHLPKAEDIIFLYVPYIALVQCFQG